MAQSETHGPGIGLDEFSEDVSTFGDRVTAGREAQGYSQAQLARRLGIKVSTLRNWEEDRSEPRANKLQMLAGVLNVSIIWLLSGEGESPVLHQGDSDLSWEADLSECLAELRDIRASQAGLIRRMGRLEQRLRALREYAT